MSRVVEHSPASTYENADKTIGGGGSSQATEALETLCRSYWYRFCAFVRRQGRSLEDAQELTQAFFAHLLTRDFLQGWSRAFLLAS
jgi:RNA polymerase sigma-70 factor (ECF subfamily)